MAAKKRTVQTSLIEEEEEDLGELGEEGQDAERQRRNQTLDVKSLPEGVRAILRLKPWRDVEEFSAYIYLRVPDPLRPGRIAKKFCRRVFNTEIEESWLQQNFPRGGRFSVIYQVRHPSKPGDVQIHTDDFEVEPSEVSGALLAPSVGTAPPASHAAGGDLGLSHLKALAEVVVMLQGNRPAEITPPAWMERMYQKRIENVAELEDRLQRKLAGPITTVHSTEPTDENAGWPDFLRPFVPTIKQYGIMTLEALGNKLMGGGLEGAGLRFFVLNNPAFKSMWADPDKRQAAATTLITTLGEVGENLVRLFSEEMAKKGQP